MKTNMGSVDRIIRVILALAAAILIAAGKITGTAAVVVGILAVVFVATSALAFCPLYLPFGISTKKKG